MHSSHPLFLFSPFRRTEFLCSKVIGDLADDLEEEDIETEGTGSNIIIHQTDFDYLPIPGADDDEEGKVDKA